MTTTTGITTQHIMNSLCKKDAHVLLAFHIRLSMHQDWYRHLPMCSFMVESESQLDEWKWKSCQEYLDQFVQYFVHDHGYCSVDVIQRIHDQSVNRIHMGISHVLTHRHFPQRFFQWAKSYYIQMIRLYYKYMIRYLIQHIQFIAYHRNEPGTSIKG